jgi:hypothetical protein
MQEEKQFTILFFSFLSPLETTFPNFIKPNKDARRELIVPHARTSGGGGLMRFAGEFINSWPAVSDSYLVWGKNCLFCDVLDVFTRNVLESKGFRRGFQGCSRAIATEGLSDDAAYPVQNFTYFQDHRRAGGAGAKSNFVSRAVQWVFRNKSLFVCEPVIGDHIVLWPCITSGIYVSAADLQNLRLQRQGFSSVVQ